MGRWIKKLFRWTMHGLAVLALLVAIASVVFWVRSRTRSEFLAYQTKSSDYSIGSVDSQLDFGVFRRGDTVLGFYARSYPWENDGFDPWTYYKLGWTRLRFAEITSTYDHFDIFGVQWTPGDGANILSIPYSYILFLSLSFSGWWFWRVRKQWKRQRAAGCCKKCGYNLHAHAPGQNCPECGTPIA